MEENFEKFMTAKRILGYNMCASKSKREDGTIDESKLDDLLKQNYEYIRGQLLGRKKLNPNFDEEAVKKEIQEIDYLYSLVKDENVRSKNDELAKEEKYANSLPKISKAEVKGIIKSYTSKPSNEESYQFEVAPEGENRKHIQVIPKRRIEYITQLGVIAYLNEYEIVKNINGIDRHFIVTTHTNFTEADKISHLDRPLTDNEKAYLKLFYMQMSDIHLKTCEKRFNGYIGSVENNIDSVKFDMDSEDYAATDALKIDREDDER